MEFMTKLLDAVGEQRRGARATGFCTLSQKEQVDRKLGISKSLCFQDVLSLDDPELLRFLPRPVHALILVFPTTEAYERRIKVEDFESKNYPDGSDDEDVVSFRQTTNNACGLYAILHAVCNGDVRNSFGELADMTEPSSPMGHLSRTCLPLRHSERALALENEQKLERAYADVAKKGDTEAPANPEDESHINGHLYQLDGDRKRPIELAFLEAEEDVLSEKCLAVIRVMTTWEEDNLSFSLMALVEQS
ncbi:cysteine proteinase [Macroventuria anomochaeta]|uniref:Cysteine proteinase n=1 Tax=Macroventuria anomochaeta TaxID=301207 RepID=A0ACB6RKD2_9PLEO|nr:cysteine proteinase [Macroventuria anomochaeta]KAF2622336.1 cysteine proteinase [Macroventuria anomochaeta]